MPSALPNRNACSIIDMICPAGQSTVRRETLANMVGRRPAERVTRPLPMNAPAIVLPETGNSLRRRGLSVEPRGFEPLTP